MRANPEMATWGARQAGYRRALPQATFEACRFSLPFYLPAGLGLNPLELRRPLAVRQLPVDFLGSDGLARLPQVSGAVPEDLGVGRLGLEGGLVGPVGQF